MRNRMTCRDLGGWLPENHLIRSTGHPADALAPPLTKYIAGAANHPATRRPDFSPGHGIRYLPGSTAPTPLHDRDNFQRLVIELFDLVFPADLFVR